MKKYYLSLLFSTSTAFLLTIGCKKDNDASSGGSVSGITVTDIDGNIYNTVTIGTQIWMKENLRTSRYRNGSSIPNVTTDGAWSALATGVWRDYANNPANEVLYGKLYNG